MAVDLTKRMFSDAKASELIQTIQELPEKSLPFSSEFNAALLACFDNVAWINDDGNSYYNRLESALRNGGDNNSFENNFLYEASNGYTLTDYGIFGWTISGSGNAEQTISDNVLNFKLSNNPSYTMFKLLNSTLKPKNTSIKVKFKLSHTQTSGVGVTFIVSDGTRKASLIIGQNGLARYSDDSSTGVYYNKNVTANQWHTLELSLINNINKTVYDGEILYNSTAGTYGESSTGIVMNSSISNAILSIDYIDIGFNY